MRARTAAGLIAAAALVAAPAPPASAAVAPAAPAAVAQAATPQPTAAVPGAPAAPAAQPGPVLADTGSATAGPDVWLGALALFTGGLLVAAGVGRGTPEPARPTGRR